MTKIHYILMAPMLWLSACATTTPVDQTHSSHFGNAVARNIEAQMIAPTPEQKANTFIPADRARQNLARDNYRKNTVKEPVPLQTTR